MAFFTLGFKMSYDKNSLLNHWKILNLVSLVDTKEELSPPETFTSENYSNTEILPPINSSIKEVPNKSHPIKEPSNLLPHSQISKSIEKLNLYLLIFFPVFMTLFSAYLLMKTFFVGIYHQFKYH